ncbi:Alw26I/Eco31I/Esp3I family type II restriction adenine-specific DNA-methyltransferase [Dickeya undicola]|uniref:DNA (cytosine-5-)-methyltransferase n=1 Tax=Dickeya undicola TaxID=1577887 RepID=A0A3N0G086_9GAMM|nr:Alw26I/Eco31I/Esp3I family type II restriction adenine-specific DNA-methyltransferase [Dickeya undicola]RNM05827.1 Alw26I/Eco31I/Esp3I family type II restriction adenine-specific DNA-methyltransferase [Dickeya undicola]RNM25557.1 Alw26I/Eco31I/Esp3I family type II restriction adenine-specific DNA-methyltransferase [Dickeya undicola]
MFSSNLNKLLDVTSGVKTTYKIGKNLEQRLTGRFYTPARIGKTMVSDVARRIDMSEDLKIIDPFCGDGRLLCWLIEAMYEQGKIPSKTLLISAWDCDQTAVETARTLLSQTIISLGISVANIEIQTTDSFEHALKNLQSFDVCVTNPPWETIRPDSRELAELKQDAKDIYVSLLKEKVFLLDKAYPYSKPARKFSGWGANLARCGIEASVRLTAPGGLFAIVAPATILGDQVSAPLRTWLFSQNFVDAIHHYPAEARLFDGVDQSAVYFVGHRSDGQRERSVLEVIQHFEQEQGAQPPILRLSLSYLEENNYAIGFGGSPEIVRAMFYFADLPKLSDYEVGVDSLFKIGRELDETGIMSKLTGKGIYRFAKGRQITRYSQIAGDAVFLKGTIPTPQSSDFHRLVWRDVARQSSARRVIATIIPPNVVTGNSLNILVPKKMSYDLLLALLGIFNSVIFEAQVRASISTNHLSVGAIRRIKVPPLLSEMHVERVSQLVEKQLREPSESLSAQIDVEVARWYGLPDDVFLGLLTMLEKHSPGDVSEIKKIMVLDRKESKDEIRRIENHYASTLSELDLRICRSVPPGGNWKDIPEDIPSERIKNIRLSFAKGEGSRSTYYGRLHPDRPSYTINTYFTRPGNGCHIHYDYSGEQHRTLSHREAARLQSFPDDFVFKGKKGAVTTQIGNAVPPLLAFQIAKHLNIVGQTVELFAGAGGLGLGFKWAGWETLVGNELEASFAETYRANVHSNILVGDITDNGIKKQILKEAEEVRDKGLPLCVLGGPPCQGFSTAGNKRSMKDERNWLFRDYCELLAAIKPDVFLFENVTGLLNMERGHVFEMIKNELSKHAKRLIVWKLHSEDYAIPQRRNRVIIVGDNTGKVPEYAPRIISTLSTCGLPRAPSVKDALDDLPALQPGQDGGDLGYRHESTTPYQALMRGEISVAQYLAKVTQ